MALAERYQQTGNFVAAEQICRQVLQADPRHAEALHLLGILAYQAGRYDDAAAQLEEAIRWGGADARFQHTLGMVRSRQGRPQEAIVCYQRALALQPVLAPVHSSLGNLYKSMGRVEEALACYDQALRLQPDLAEAHNNRGNLLKQMGRLEEAERSYQSAVRLRPELPQPHYHLGLVQARQDRLAEAVRSYAEALRLWPQYAEAHIALGDVLTRLSRLEEAEAHYRHARRLRPEVALIYNNLGIVLAAQARLAEEQAKLAQTPTRWFGAPQSPSRLAGTAEAEKKRAEAMACYEQAVRIQPDYSDALSNLANGYLNQGRQDEALACFRKALAARPEDPVLHSAVLFASHYPASYDPDACFAETLRWAEKFADPAARLQAPQPVARDPDRRLRIGYVSADFRSHVVGRYSEAVVAAHDRDAFEVFCYANVPQADPVTERIKAAADHWRVIAGRSDADTAQQILQDRIDLLFDLSGHTMANSMGVFVRKPAPIQVTHFGYPSSTGLATMDYRITDGFCDPPGQTERWHTEKLVRLPETFWCYVPWASPEIGPVPAQRAGEVAFACACILSKVTTEMMSLWAQILTALPKSRMFLVAGAGPVGDEGVRATFAKHGIAAERVTLVPRQGVEGYLRLFQEVDVVLDVYPFTGCNTTADALWMGVPVISLVGPTAATRQGLSILSQVGLEDLAVPTPEAYVETAVRLAQDLSQLRALRGQLRERVQRSMGDVARFTRQLEAAYREMWKTYCAVDHEPGA
jgi:protein O-GlcNAc transferase